MMVPLPQTGHGCPTKVSALPVAGAEAGAEGVRAGDGEDAGTFGSAFAFFSLGALALRSRFRLGNCLLNSDTSVRII